MIQKHMRSFPTEEIGLHSRVQSLEAAEASCDPKIARFSNSDKGCALLGDLPLR